MTANVITYRGRSAAREIGKALNFSPSIIDRFSHLFASGDFAHTMELEAQIGAAGLAKKKPRMASLHPVCWGGLGFSRPICHDFRGTYIFLEQIQPLLPADQGPIA